MPDSVIPRFLKPDIELSQQADGSLLLRERQPLRPYKPRLGDYLRLWAGSAPERTFLAERQADGNWHRLSYAAALVSVERLAAGLLELELGPDHPVMILSANSIRFALLQLAALHIGLPVAPVSPAYSLQSDDFARLKAIATLLTPGLVFAEDSEAFRPALNALATALTDTPYTVLTATDDAEGAVNFEQLTQSSNDTAVYRAYHHVTPNTVAKILFTSGSTGQPKGVINTQGMLCANQQSLLQIWPFLIARPPIILDWLPWHHTFGGNHNFNLVLRHGGTLYLDKGKPLPGLIEQTLTNLHEIAPTIYFNVPAGYDALISHLERDLMLAERFFSDLDLLFCAAASLPARLAERLARRALEIRGEPLPFVSAWGTTETAPLATATPVVSNGLQDDQGQTIVPAAISNGSIGVPVPGVEVKLVPSMETGKVNSLDAVDAPLPAYELRVRGPNVTPAYWRQIDASLRAFDDDGFYRSGDAGRLQNPADPSAGVLFIGRLAENFKLSSGVWVRTGPLRLALLAACSPLLRDVIIVGQDRAEIGVLLLPSLEGCQSVLGEQAKTLTLAELAQQRKLRTQMVFLLRQYNAQHLSNSTRVGRALFLTEPLSVDAGELTDKGYINQRAVLTRRPQIVAKLFSGHPDVLVMPS